MLKRVEAMWDALFGQDTADHNRFAQFCVLIGTAVLINWLIFSSI